MLLVFIHPDQSEVLTIQCVRELTQLEAEDYKRAAETIGEYTRHKFAPRMVYENYTDFFSIMQDCLKHYFSGKSNPEGLQEYAFIANKALLNYLSSARFSTDFVSTQIARRYGKKSEESSSFKDALSRSFDSSFAYRFLYKFRNYVQHCGTAVEHIEIRVRPNEMDDASLTLTCKTATLLKQYKEWGRVTADLQRMETIDLKGVVTELTTEIEKLDDLASYLICPELKIAGSRIKQIISDALHQDGTPVIFEIYESEGVIEQVPIKHPPLELLAQLGLLQL